MKIGKREIGPDHPPYLIAEVGANHGGDLKRALHCIEAAKAAGADAVKFQAYTADTITIDSDRPEFTLTEGPWQGWRLYDLYRRCQTPFGWFEHIAAHARKCKIDWFASAFDETAVDVLDKLDCVAIKVASFELVDTPLIEYAARTKRPLILSTGMADYEEIDRAVLSVARAQGADPALLHCVSGYPTPVDQAGLNRFAEMRQLLKPFPVGISDHTVGIEVPVAATALGATIIEKHFTLSHRHRTPDSMFSMEPTEFNRMANSVRSIWKGLQPGSQARSEQSQKPLRRSLYAVEDIPAGAPFTKRNVRSIRPGNGLPPARINSVLISKAKKDIVRGTPLSDDLLG